ncbi:hypothetical protein BCR35DRAFT_336530, partial [Leucosporidium creatinivorum]
MQKPWSSARRSRSSAPEGQTQALHCFRVALGIEEHVQVPTGYQVPDVLPLFNNLAELLLDAKLGIQEHEWASMSKEISGCKALTTFGVFDDTDDGMPYGWLKPLPPSLTLLELYTRAEELDRAASIALFELFNTSSHPSLKTIRTVTLAQAQQWHSDHSSSWSTAESSSASFTALPLPVPTASSSNSSGSADDYTSGLIAALNAHDFTVLATIVGSSSGAITDLLQGGNKTLFAPSDSALSSLASTASSLGFPLDSSDPSTLNTLLSYHIVPRPIEPSDMYEDVPTIVETELTDPRWVQLPDSAPQVLVLLPTSPPSDQFVIQRLLVNTTTVASFTYENLVIRRIDSVLIPPPSLSTILGAPTPEVNLSTFAGAQPSELVSLVNATGITVFAPTNEALAFSLSSGELAGHTRQEVVNTIANHFVQPGTVLYSTNLTSGLNVTSASGQPLGVVTNSTGRFITSNRTTARIVRNNILLSF